SSSPLQRTPPTSSLFPYTTLFRSKAAPPFALMEAVLAAIGFIVPQAGPALKRWGRDQSEYLRLRALSPAVRVLAPAAPARFGLWVPPDLRVPQRPQRIHDALRRLAPYLHAGLSRAVYAEAARTRPEAKARATAGAVALREAIDAYRDGTPARTTGQPSRVSTAVTDHLGAVSVALHRPRSLDSIRRRVTTTESPKAHA